MHIQINEQYRISGDVHNWSIDKKVKPTVKKPDGWQAFQYYQTIGACVNGLAELMLRTSDAKTLADALDVTKNVCHTLTSALSPEYEVILKTDNKTTG